jgi:hypothetical protein
MIPVYIYLYISGSSSIYTKNLTKSLTTTVVRSSFSTCVHFLPSNCHLLLACARVVLLASCHFPLAHFISHDFSSSCHSSLCMLSSPLRSASNRGIPTPHDPRIKRWVDLMAQHAFGPIVKYKDVFFNYLRTQILMVDDYAYVGLDLRGDSDLALPKGSLFGDIGKKEILFISCFLLFLQI